MERVKRLRPANAPFEVVFEGTGSLSGRARVGRVFGAHSQATSQTPAPLLLSLRGAFPNLPAALVPRCGVAGENSALVQIPMLDFIVLNAQTGFSGVDLVNALENKPLHAIADATRGAVLFLSLKAAGSDDFADGGPGGGRSNAVGGDGRGGARRVKLTPAEVLKLQRALQCDFFEAPSEQAVFYMSDNVADRSVVKTASMLQELVDAAAVDPSLQLLGSIQGGFELARRRTAAEDVAKHESHLSGYVVSGMNGGETLENRIKCLAECVTAISSPRLLRVCGGTGSPSEVLESIAKGMDVIESSYPFESANSALALRLSSSRHKMDLRDTKYRLDRRVLVPGCPCEACSGYSRAYIHHLINVHEILGTSLLAIHNLYDYWLFFEQIRCSILQDRFLRFRQEFYDAMDAQACAEDGGSDTEGNG
ncbi:Queuine tRNA-ribosyltransferase [Porphyridium purpureum]|uniref:Queuine tRNA-ribosyltransferase n=1 Tax=Porphyridium purpureum TaxID=35688 RepID=A0A5J4YY92_PORPP|nr:Queuine tRNA-ribosyltransferase [Porphyridium purpureum]|eukprot:POR8669..scf209_3